MPETPKTGPEKSRGSRSFGPPLLLFCVLVFVLLYAGGQTFNKPVELTQDQYLWYLYNGNIQRQEFQGTPQSTNLVTGTLVVPGQSGKEQEFRVAWADVKRNEDGFRQIRAELTAPRDIAPAALTEALEGGWYRPVRARSLSAFDREPVAAAAAQATDGAAGSDAPAASAAPARGRSRAEERLWVQVIAQSRSAWEAHVRATKGGFDPDRDQPFWLPEPSGYLWLDVELSSASDLGALLARLETSGTPVERMSFDLTETGSRWGDTTSRLVEILLIWGPWILILAVFFMFLRQFRSQGGAGGLMSFGRSRAQLYSKENRTNVTFSDVAGAEEAKSEVSELVEFLKNPGRFTRIGGRIPRGVLLVGPPGCGKTLLAKAIAGEAEVPFFSISGSDFVEMFVGVGASRVRDLFKQARENSPCIIFLDEIDAVGRRRGSGMGGGHDEREQTLNAILVEMDGFGTDEGIIVIAATNRPDVLDPALLRPGRFDRQVVIDLPDYEGRKAILSVHLKRVKHVPEIDVDRVARATPGYSGADLAAIVNEAAIMAVLDRREQIAMADLDEAREKVIFGRQKRSRKMEEEDRKIVAFHEAGHAIVAAFIPEVDPPHKVTIVPRGRALGLTTFLPEREQYHMQRRRLFGQLSVAFGGRVAEQEFCGDISAGASDDIRKATDMARTMVTELGMSERIGPINYAERQGSDFLGTEIMRGKMHSEETAREIDQEVADLTQRAYQRALEIVRTHRTALEELALALLSYETLTGEEVRRILAGTPRDQLRPKPANPSGGASAPATSTSAATNAPRTHEDPLPGNGPIPGLSPA